MPPPRSRDVFQVWERDPNGRLLPRPPPYGTRAPNDIIWGHSLSDFMWIYRLPKSNVVTCWSRSMIREFGENYDEDKFPFPEPKPRRRRPWPVLKIPRRVARSVKLDPPVGAIDEGSDHEEYDVYETRWESDEDEDDKRTEGEDVKMPSVQETSDHELEEDPMIPNYTENPAVDPYGNVYSRLWAPRHRVSNFNSASPTVREHTRSTPAYARFVQDTTSPEYKREISRFMEENLKPGEKPGSHPSPFFDIVTLEDGALGIVSKKLKFVFPSAEPANVESESLAAEDDVKDKSKTEAVDVEMSTQEHMAETKPVSMESEPVAAEDDVKGKGKAEAADAEMSTPEQMAETGEVHVNGTLVDVVHEIQVIPFSKPVVREDDPKDKGKAKAQDEEMSVPEEHIAESEGTHATNFADLPPAVQEFLHKILPSNEKDVENEGGESAKGQFVFFTNPKCVPEKQGCKDKKDESGPTAPPVDPYKVKGIPKLEEFIPKRYFPDVLMVHDPHSLTMASESRHDHSLRDTEPPSYKYKRVLPVFPEDSKKKSSDAASASDSNSTEPNSSQRVAHLYISPKNKLGVGHHSLVYRAGLKLPPPLSAHSANKQVTVAAKVAIQNREARQLLENEADIYNKFPEHLMEEWCGFNLVTPIRYPVPVGAVVPKFYGYYKPVFDEAEEKKNRNKRSYEKRSPILLLEECGEPIEPHYFSDDERAECYSLLLRLHYADFLQNSFYVRNILMQPGPLTVPPEKRSKKHPSFRIIDFGRAERCEPDASAEVVKKFDNDRFHEDRKAMKELAYANNFLT